MEYTRNPKSYVVSAGPGRVKNITEISHEELQEHYMNAVDLIEDLDEKLDKMYDQLRVLQGFIVDWRFKP